MRPQPTRRGVLRPYSPPSLDVQRQVSVRQLARSTGVRFRAVFMLIRQVSKWRIQELVSHPHTVLCAGTGAHSSVRRPTGGSDACRCELRTSRPLLLCRPCPCPDASTVAQCLDRSLDVHGSEWCLYGQHSDPIRWHWRAWPGHRENHRRRRDLRCSGRATYRDVGRNRVAVRSEGARKREYDAIGRRLQCTRKVRPDAQARAGRVRRPCQPRRKYLASPTDAVSDDIRRVAHQSTFCRPPSSASASIFTRHSVVRGRSITCTRGMLALKHSPSAPGKRLVRRAPRAFSGV